MPSLILSLTNCTKGIILYYHEKMNRTVYIRYHATCPGLAWRYLENKVVSDLPIRDRL